LLQTSFRCHLHACLRPSHPRIARSCRTGVPASRPGRPSPPRDGRACHRTDRGNEGRISRQFERPRPPV